MWCAAVVLALQLRAVLCGRPAVATSVNIYNSVTQLELWSWTWYLNWRICFEFDCTIRELILQSSQRSISCVSKLVDPVSRSVLIGAPSAVLMGGWGIHTTAWGAVAWTSCVFLSMHCVGPDFEHSCGAYFSCCRFFQSVISHRAAFMLRQLVDTHVCTY